MKKKMEIQRTSLRKTVEEKASAKKLQQEERQRQIPYLPNDIISNVLIRLHYDCLLRSKSVCKAWNDIIKGHNFIDSHLHRSEPVLIFLTSICKENFYAFPTTSTLPERPTTFSVEASFLQKRNVPVFGQPIIHPTTKLYIRFMEFRDGKIEVGEYNISCLGKIKATCDGMILLENKTEKSGLILLNPVTRKLFPLPLGTLSCTSKESYGLALSKSSGEYKLVHLFYDNLHYINCEILSLRTKVWRGVNGPDSGLFGRLGCRPVLAIGALHWMPMIDQGDHIVSMEVDNEKFQKILLPKSRRIQDSLIEVHSHLGYVTHEEVDQIDVWILKGFDGEVWMKLYRITEGYIEDIFPYLSLKDGSIIFKRKADFSFYEFNSTLKVLRKIEANKEISLASSFLPHINSFVSCESMDMSEGGGI